MIMMREFASIGYSLQNIIIDPKTLNILKDQWSVMNGFVYRIWSEYDVMNET